MQSGQGTPDKGRDERTLKMVNDAEDADYKKPGYSSGNKDHDAWVRAGRPKSWPVKQGKKKSAPRKRG